MVKYSEKKMDEYGRGVVFKLQEFDSIHDLTTYLEKAQVNTKCDPGQTESSKRQAKGTEDKPAWEGTNTYGQAVELLGSGWTTVAQKLAKRIPTATKSMAATKSKPTYGVVGGNCSVPRYIQGIPTNMIDRKQIPMKSKIIVINKDISFSSMVSPTTIFEEGVKALQIIQGLEGKGYRVKLNMCWAARDTTEIVGLRVTVKKPEERLSLQKIAFPIAHPSMLRRIGFRWMETHPTMVKRFGAYGTPATTEMSKVLDKKEIFLPKQIPDVDKFIEGLGL